MDSQTCPCAPCHEAAEERMRVVRENSTWSRRNLPFCDGLRWASCDPCSGEGYGWDDHPGCAGWRPCVACEGKGRFPVMLNACEECGHMSPEGDGRTCREHLREAVIAGLSPEVVA